MTFDQWRSSDAYWLLQQLDFRPNKWVSEYEMTAEEKQAHPTYETTGGYLKVCDIDKVFIEWWNKLSSRERKIIQNIPNFNAEKFLQITGIAV